MDIVEMLKSKGLTEEEADYFEATYIDWGLDYVMDALDRYREDKERNAVVIEIHTPITFRLSLGTGASFADPSTEGAKINQILERNGFRSKMRNSGQGGETYVTVTASDKYFDRISALMVGFDIRRI